MNFVAQKMLTGDRARLCSKLIALCLALFAGPALYGQSESTATSQRTGVLRGCYRCCSGCLYLRSLSCRVPTWVEFPRAQPVQRRYRFPWKTPWLAVCGKTLGDCFPPTPSPAREANGGRHSARCCQI